jgi:hypothetical protein
MAYRGVSKRGRKRANRLNYNLAPEPEFTYTFTALYPPEFEEELQKLPRTHDRIQAALMACAEMDVPKPGSGRTRLKAESAFRNALTEYVAVEDTLNREMPAGKPRFRLHSTQNPLPHVLKLLRHLQTHGMANELSGIIISLWLKNVPGAEPTNVPVWVISDLADARLLELDAFAEGFYTPAQATEMVNWVKTRQGKFGIGDIIHRGILEAAERIVTTYLPRAKGTSSPS